MPPVSRGSSIPGWFPTITSSIPIPAPSLPGPVPTNSPSSRTGGGPAAAKPAPATTRVSCTSRRSTWTTGPNSSPGATSGKPRRPKRWPRFLKTARNRFLLHQVAVAYPGRFAPSDYLLSDDPEIALIWEINSVCAETGLLVEKYANETVEESYRNEKGKQATRMVPRWTIEEILTPGFDPGQPARQARKRVTGPALDEAVREEIDVSAME